MKFLSLSLFMKEGKKEERKEEREDR